MKFFTLIIATLALMFLTSYLLNIDRLTEISYSLSLTEVQLKKMLSVQNKLKWFTFPFIAIFLMIKTVVVASILYIGAFFYSKTKLTFNQLWHITIKSEFIFLFVSIFKIIWFYFFQTSYTLEDIQYFYPLSALNIVGYHGLETYFIYPFQIINLFELGYILLLGYYVGKLAYTSYEKGTPTDFGLKIVAISYVPALFLWVTLVMFFTLNFS